MPVALDKKPSAYCFDAGSRFCPCELASLGECVACSLLRGEDQCRCGWSGVCVYQEFLRSGKAIPPRRKESQVPVLARTDIQCSADRRAFLLEVAVPDDMANWCSFPGSFVLLRPKGSPDRFNVPVSVMDARDGRLKVAIEVRGPKTVALEQSCLEGRQVTVVGPYWSGLQGERLSKHRGDKVLGFAKGIGQAPLVHAARYVVTGGGYFKALIGPGDLGAVFSEELLIEEGASVEVLPKAKDHNVAALYSELCRGGYGLLMSAGSDKQHRSLSDLISSLEAPPAFAWTSNLTVVCAEGICGACLAGGLRGCKADIERFEGGAMA